MWHTNFLSASNPSRISRPVSPVAPRSKAFCYCILVDDLSLFSSLTLNSGFYNYLTDSNQLPSSCNVREGVVFKKKNQYSD